MRPSIYLLIGLASLCAAISDEHALLYELIKNESFIIDTLAADPFTYIESKSGKLDYSGYIKDFLDLAKAELGFQYSFRQPEDMRYGAYNAGRWTGMIGDLLNNKCDIAAAPITITHQREAFVDFIQPFAHVGLSVLIAKPHTLPNHEEETWHLNFNIFKPLSASVWVTVFAMMVLVWLFLAFMNRFNPYELGEEHKRHLASEEQATLFSWSGALWFTFTTLQWQGFDRSPRSIASRVMGCFWMAFVTLTLVTYISSFVNQMFWASTVHQRLQPDPIRSLADLAENRSGYTYGTVRGGSTYYYMTESAQSEEVKKMGYYLKSRAGDEDGLVDSTNAGIERAKAGKYAFIGETMTIRHRVTSDPDCSLKDIGVVFGMRSYGLAVAHKFKYKELFDQVTLKLIESGEIDALEERWFNARHCRDVESSERSRDMTLYLSKGEPERVSFHMFTSAIILITVGFILSVIVAAGEILWFKYRGREQLSEDFGTTPIIVKEDSN